MWRQKVVNWVRGLYLRIKLSTMVRLMMEKPMSKQEKETKASVDVKKINIEKISASDACLKLTELDNHTCRWPIGDPREDNFCFCGKKVRVGQTYCEEHSALAYVKPIVKKG